MIVLLDRLVCQSHQGRISLVIVNVPTLILVLVACRRRRSVLVVVSRVVSFLVNEVSLDMVVPLVRVVVICFVVLV